MSMTVRRAGEADADAISRLSADVQEVHSTALPDLFKPPAAYSFPPAEVAELIRAPESLLFLAEIDSQPVGYAYAEVIRRPDGPFRLAQEMVYLHHISVRPDHRRKVSAMRSSAPGGPLRRSSASRFWRSMSGASTRRRGVSSSATDSRPITRDSGIDSPSRPLTPFMLWLRHDALPSHRIPCLGDFAPA